MLLKKTLFFILLSITSSYANSSLVSGLANVVEEAEEQKAKDNKVLNYAFKQRMRTQLIARDALLIAMDFNHTFYQKEMLKTAKMFDENFNNLINSKKDIEKAEKLDLNFSKKIEELKKIWLSFYDNVKKISKNHKDKEALEFIGRNNIKLLDNVEYIFSSFINSHHSSSKLEAAMAHIKSMLYTQVGKPRMYINKLVKERLLVKQNIDRKKNQENLKQTIKDMDRLMKALKDGDKELELNGTEDKNILEKLSVSQKLWEEVKSLVLKEKLNKKEWNELINKNIEFIEAQTKVVKLTRASSDN